jgi:hypothetical protein
MAFQSGMLVRGSDPAIYLVENGERRWIPDLVTLQSNGFDPKSILRVEDEELERIPQGAALPSTMPVLERPDGALLTATGDVYIMEAGQRRLVPDPVTFLTNDFDATAIERITEPELNAVPEGPPLEAATYLEHYRYNDLGYGRKMESWATLNVSSRRLYVRTHVYSTWNLSGFTGGVAVVFFNTDGKAFDKTDVQAYGVDGRWIGVSSRTEHWFHDLNDRIVAETGSIEVFHSHAGRNRLLAILDQGVQAAKRVAEIGKALKEAGIA